MKRKLTVFEAAKSYRFNELFRVMKMMDKVNPGWSKNYATYEYRLTWNTFSKVHHDHQFNLSCRFNANNMSWTRIEKLFKPKCCFCGKTEKYVLKTWTRGNQRIRCSIDTTIKHEKNNTLSYGHCYLGIPSKYPKGTTAYFDDLSIAEK